MESNLEITNNIISTINTIFKNLFSSIDNNLYKILDDLVFINSDILSDRYFEKILGQNSQNGILLVANSLIIGFVLYYSIKFLLSNFTYERVENPVQFIFRCVVYGVCMNCSFFIIEQVLNLNSTVCELIKSIGEDFFGREISFSELINAINLSTRNSNLDIFTLDGLIKGTLSFSLLSLVFSYSLRYVMIKILVLLSPFAFLSLSLESTSHFFKSWYKNLFSLLFIQIIVSIVLLLLFSMDFSDGNLINKFIYIGGIYSLIRANSIVRDLLRWNVN